MHILFICQYLPYPLNSGTRIRAYHLLQNLAKRGRITLLYYTRSQVESAQSEYLHPLCERIIGVPLRRSPGLDILTLLTSLTRRTPFFILRDASSSMRQAIIRLAEEDKFDIIHADQLNMAQFARFVPGPATVVDNHNVLSDLISRMAKTEKNLFKKTLLKVEAAKMRSYERQIIPQFDEVLVVSEQDRKKYRAITDGKSDPTVVPIGIELEAIKPVARLQEARDVLCVGTMLYPSNAEGVIWFARKVWPKISRHLPKATFRIVGDKPGRRVRALAENRSILVMGYLERLEQVVAKSAVFVVPLHSGSGMRVKILNAFALGIPVVSTALGCEGIEVVNGKHLLLADTPEAFGEAVLRIITDHKLAERLISNARELVERRYSWQTVYESLNPVYDRLLARRGTGRLI